MPAWTPPWPPTTRASPDDTDADAGAAGRHGGPRRTIGGDAREVRTPDAGPAVLVCDNDAGHPTDLGCTGLYSDWPSRTISPDAVAFDPGLHLWADTADKSRYIYFPPGTKIDTTDLNEWTFPIGTKVWKEFRLLNSKVETRFLWKLGPQTWFRTTYAWSDDQSSAPELVGGQTNVRGLGYEIPSTDQCATCHGGRIDFLLGFEIVSLNTPQSSGLNMTALLAQGLLTAPPTAKATIPGTTNTVASLGFLHSNCGNACHNRSPSAFAGSTGLFMRMQVDATGALPTDPTQLDTWTTAVNVVSTFQPAGVPAGTFVRLRPGDPTTSAIPYRDGRRDGVAQMPPIATHLVDFADMAVLNTWITNNLQ